MSAAGLYRVLGLDGYRVLDSWPSETDGRLRVLIEAPREALRCRACGCSRVHVHEHAVRSWESAPIGLTPVDVVMDSPRVKCLKCGAKTWHQPTFANGQRRITKTFEAFIERQLTRLTIQDVVEMSGISWNTVSEIDLARLKKLARPKLGGLKRLAIDENYLGARHGFVTIVLDLDTMAIMSVLKGRGKAGPEAVLFQAEAGSGQDQSRGHRHVRRLHRSCHGAPAAGGFSVRSRIRACSEFVFIQEVGTLISANPR